MDNNTIICASADDFGEFLLHPSAAYISVQLVSGISNILKSGPKCKMLSDLCQMRVKMSDPNAKTNGYVLPKTS